MAINLDDLGALPRPEIIETLDYEAILTRRKVEFIALAQRFGFTYDVGSLETDPAVILLQEAAYQEVLLRGRGNDIARAPYLYFARGSEVDHLGFMHDCYRLPGEADDRYKARIVLAIRGRSTGGTEPRYRGITLGASLRVADAVVYTEGEDPTVYIAVFAADNNGVADEALLDEVRAAVTAPAVRMVNDRIVVRSAVVQVVPVAADIWLLPNTPESILGPLAADLPGLWAAEGGLGRDLTRAWLTARLMIAGVQRVEVATADIVMRPHEAVRIGAVTLTNRGRAY